MKPPLLVLSVLVLPVLVLAPTSCARDESETSTATAVEGTELQGESRIPAPEPNPDTDTGADPGAAPGPGGGVPRGTTQGVIRRIPEDVVIGQLEDRLDGPAPPLGAVEELFRELAAGRMPSALFASDVRADLEQRLEYMMERAAVAAEVRIGALVRLSETAYRVPVVAFGKQSGRTSGEIYVAESDGAWYISDILLDLTRIDEDVERPIFEPGSEGPTLLSF
ncbi:MAG: hypothetical protein GVY23_09955 [Spirochaetes bacterium]|jgi:hypothetical protein|nr:hypothetical protein [Spirochaetota bacterium]